MSLKEQSIITEGDTMSEQSGSWRKFTTSEKKAALKAIREFISNNDNAKPLAIANHLNQLSITHPNGEWTGPRVSGFRWNNPIRRSRTAPAPSMEPTPSKVSDAVSVAEIILASNLDSGAKETVLRALFNGKV